MYAAGIHIIDYPSESFIIMANIGVIGGTGALGKAIAKRLAKAGHNVTIGSRSAESASEAAQEIGAAGGATNADAATAKDFVIVTVPYSAHAGTLAQIKDHVGSAIVVDTTVPLVPPRLRRKHIWGQACVSSRPSTALPLTS